MLILPVRRCGHSSVRFWCMLWSDYGRNTNWHSGNKTHACKSLTPYIAHTMSNAKRTRAMMEGGNTRQGAPGRPKKSCIRPTFPSWIIGAAATVIQKVARGRQGRTRAKFIMQKKKPAERIAVAEQVMDVARCSVCYEVGKTLFQCHEGHIVCGACKDRLMSSAASARCPTCRREMTDPPRCRALETLVAALKTTPCPLAPFCECGETFLSLDAAREQRPVCEERWRGRTTQQLAQQLRRLTDMTEENIQRDAQYFENRRLWRKSFKKAVAKGVRQPSEYARIVARVLRNLQKRPDHPSFSQTRAVVPVEADPEDDLDELVALLMGSTDVAQLLGAR